MKAAGHMRMGVAAVLVLAGAGFLGSVADAGTLESGEPGFAETAMSGGALIVSDTVEYRFDESRSVTAVRTALETAADGGIFWKGDVISDADPISFLQIFVYNDLVTVKFQNQASRYSVLPIKNDERLVFAADGFYGYWPVTSVASCPPEAGVGTSPDPRERIGYASEACVQQKPLCAAAAGGVAIVDVLMEYPAIMVDSFGLAGTDNLMRYLLAELNNGLVFSRANTQMRMVGHSINLDTTPDIAMGARLLGNSDEEKARRNALGADLTAYINFDGYSGAGNAYIYQGFSGIGVSCSRLDKAINDICLMHEIGHNLGLDHAKGQDNTTNPAQPTYSYALNWATYRSVMAYPTVLVQSTGTPNTFPFYTNPEVSFNGVPSGNVTEADQARTVREIAPMVADYRATVIVDTLADLAVTGGSGSGTYKAGSRAYIAANAPEEATVFLHWTGRSDLLADSTAATASLLLPAEGAELSAVYSSGQTALVVETAQGVTLETRNAGKTVSISVPTEGRYTMQIISLNGQLQQERHLQLSARSLGTVHLNQYAAGSYILHIFGEGTSMTKQIIVR